MIVTHIVNYRSKDPRFYLTCALEVYICYNKLLLSTYNKKNLPHIYIADYLS